MTFDFDKIRDDPQAAYVVGVVLGMALGYLIARRPPKSPPAWLRRPAETVRIVEAPCAGCAEKQAIKDAEGAHLES